MEILKVPFSPDKELIPSGESVLLSTQTGVLQAPEEVQQTTSAFCDGQLLIFLRRPATALMQQGLAIPAWACHVEHNEPLGWMDSAVLALTTHHYIRHFFIQLQ